MSHVVDVEVQARIARRLEGEDDAQPVEIARHGVHALAFPRPHLRADVHVHRNLLPAGPFGHPEVESWIVDDQDAVGPERENVGLHPGKELPDEAQPGQHFREPHDRGVRHVLHELHARFFHRITAHAPHLDVGPFRAQGVHHTGGMGFAGGLSGEDVDPLRSAVAILLGHCASICNQTMAMTMAIITSRVPRANRSIRRL